MYPDWLPLLGGQFVPEGSRNSDVCCLTSDLKVILVNVHDLLKKSWKFRIKCPNWFYF